MNRRLIYILLIIASVTGLASCKDDLIYDPSGVDDGEATVEATLFFENFNPGVLGGSRSAGDVVKQVENLCVLLYDDAGKLRYSFYGTDGNRGSFEALSIDQGGNSSRPDDGETSAESKTPSASIRFAGVPNGYYRIYAVANMGDVAHNSHSSDVQTVEGLKNIRLTWTTQGAGNSVTKNHNHQMLGYFCEDGSAHGFDAPTVRINRKVNLYCWLRRAASKVTVAFDATRLNQNVTIYLQSVEIKNVPVSCLLGADNTPLKAADVADGEKIMYSDAADHTAWPAVTRGRRNTFGLLAPGQKHDDDSRLPVAQYHTELTPALYFYENIQGEGKDKRQDADGDGSLDAPGRPGDPEYIDKDNKPYGTYIEVKGFYRSLNSEGTITYRFMLGKDEKCDYNAERNFHYKLTLVFNGRANDVDWHIEYKEDKDIIPPNPYYISYLYDEDVMLPIRLKGKDWNNVKLRARIIENAWWPDSPKIDIVTPGTEYNHGVWHGFLSLTTTTDKVIGDGMHYKNNATWNKDYWTSHPRKGQRDYEKLNAFGTYEPVAGEGAYTVADDVEYGEGIVVSIPFFTRAKQMVPLTGYTGNNPFVAYQRKALLELTLLDSKTNTVIINSKGLPRRDTVTIYQVRRVENPKGIWRRWNNDAPFLVTLMERRNEDDKNGKFDPIISDGEWRAYVESGKDWIKINDVVNGTAAGDHDTKVRFKYQPDGTLADSTKVRCGVIVVEYNNYTCKHRIFIRQGYAPLSLNDAKIRWHTFNLYSKTEETKSPVEEGSLFKFRNLDDAILASNNTRFGFHVNPGSQTFDLAGGDAKSWSNIKASVVNGNNVSAYFDDLTLTQVTGVGKNVKVRLATQADYRVLRNGANREFGYGVLYADGADSVATTADKAYGYMRELNDGARGMRGCFVYNTVNGNNLFFPIGATGYGRRGTDKTWYGDGPAYSGSLHYAWRMKIYGDRDQILYRPLFNDVYRRPGAIYWTRGYRTNGSGSITEGMSLDVNYFTFDFDLQNGNEPISTSTGGNQESSACFIRCVEDVD